MKDLLKKKQILKVVPNNIDNALITAIEEIDDCFLTVKIVSGSSDYYRSGDKVEAYALTKSGFVFFKAVIDEINTNSLIFKRPNDYNCLQRRAYERVAVNRIIMIRKETDLYDADLVDISVGGLKFLTKSPIEVDETYSLQLSLDKNISINCDFSVIKLDTLSNGSHVIQGRFVNLKNLDKIQVAQFCKKKQLEDFNK